MTAVVTKNSAQQQQQQQQQHGTLPPVIDVENEHYPFCIVWSPLPLLTWFLPFVGHVGICDSVGRIYDFQGSFRIGKDRMLFGRPTKYWDISRTYCPAFYDQSTPDSPEKQELIRQQIAQYDEAIQRATQHFRQTQHYNFLFNNCHVFAAAAENMQTLSRTHSNAFTVGVGLVLYGRFVSWSRCFATYTPFVIFLVIVFLLYRYFS